MSLQNYLIKLITKVFIKMYHMYNVHHALDMYFIVVILTYIKGIF